MGAWDAVASRVAGGVTVTSRPSGSSMVPLIRSRQQVVVAPVAPSKLEVETSSSPTSRGRYTCNGVVRRPRQEAGQSSNNRGHVNGWTSHDRVFGLCVAVDGVPRSGIAGKTPAASRRADPVVEGWGVIDDDGVEHSAGLLGVMPVCAFEGAVEVR
ncbi:S26 family signal peptidase [Streptomyces sp. NPDC047971]|uniref:S26 family signal peptidase n=1 Tax=Streptomyces sp. NPDC047971 TaxID=3154499 RepID=UPI00340BA4C0